MYCIIMPVLHLLTFSVVDSTDTGANNSTCSSFSQPVLPQVEVPVPQHLFVEYSSIRASYTRMLYNVCKFLKRKLDLDDIKEFLSCYSTSLSKKVEQCSDLSSILRHIKDECSLTNIELLHSIVEEMEITEAREHIETYRAELKEFYKSISVSLCLDKRFDSVSHLKCETVTFIFDWKPEEHVLQDIKSILSKVSGKLLIIKFIGSSTSISITCSFPFSDVEFTVLKMIENIHILMGQGLKKLTIGNLILWRRQSVRLKEHKDQDLLQHTDVISYIILEEAGYKLRDAINSKKKETIELKQEISMTQVPKENFLSVQSDTESIKKVEEEQLDEELTVLRSQFNEVQKENKELSDKLSKMKVDYLRSLTSKTDSAASKVRRGMAFEIDDCKFHLEAMAKPDYLPLVDNKRIIEKLQERITLMNMELITEREHIEKIMIDIKDHLKEAEDRQREKEKKEIEKEIHKIYICGYHPVTGELKKSTLSVHKDELLPTILDKAYELMELAPLIPMERCRLVKYNYWSKVMNQSFDLDEFHHQTIGQVVGRAKYLFLETRKRNETFKKYNDGGINLKISVVDLSTGKVEPAKIMRGEEGWTVEELKQHIGEFLNIHSSCMRVVQEYMYNYLGGTSVRNITDTGSFKLGKILYGGNSLLYASSDPEDYQKEFEDSLMYRYVDFHIHSILLNVTIPPGPKTLPTITNRPEGGILMKVISVNEDDNGNERKIQIQIYNKITLAQFKEELVPLIGVSPTGFIVYQIVDNERYEMKELDRTMNIKPGSELTVTLGRSLGRGEYRIKLYLLQVKNTEFCKYMMESIVAKDTPVREFKKKIIKEAKAQEIDCVLELDKLRLRNKNGVSPGRVYLDDQHIYDTSNKGEVYVELLKGPVKDNYRQTQVYVIRWRPSQCSFDPIEEIILDDTRQIIEKLSELSGVPVEYIYCVETLLFPVVSCLDIENRVLNWYSITSRKYPLRKFGDGCFIYYKDNRETMKELTDKERSEIQEAEEARLESWRRL
uniref:Ubiquitin carboxyl-terminal hydrolase 47 C-terminal domain-containing protein n=1 Tax=Amphimedon queenslandica TaxID=400682 RepID=A0A1X7VG81_AMPQE